MIATIGPDTVRRWGLVAAVNVLLIAAAFSGAEWYLRDQGKQPYVRTFPGQQPQGDSVPWARADPALGWTIEPSFLPGQINPQGFRDSKDFQQSPRDAARTRLLVLGDSFVVGANVGADRSLPGLLQARLWPPYEVFNLAAPGWGIDQMYLAYEAYKEILDPDIVVLAFIDDDIERVLESYRPDERLTKPTLTVEDGQVARRGPASVARLRLNQWLGRSVLLSHLVREFYLGTEAKSLVGRVFASIANDRLQRGGKTIVLRIPTRDDDEAINRFRRYQRHFAPSFAGTPVVFVDAAADIAQVPGWTSTFYEEDGHMNAAGNQRLAATLLAHLSLAP